MNRGIYTAASGLLTAHREISTRSNNLANANTPGYKFDILETETFGQQLAIRRERMAGRIDTPIGRITLGARAASVYTVYSQGPFEETGRPLDAAIIGDGFFTVERPGGGVWYTRNGQFQLDADGYLITGQGLRVMGLGGPIQLQSADFTINEFGGVIQDDDYIDTLAIYVPADYADMLKGDEGFFTTAGADAAFEGRVIQGALELSNTDALRDMVGLMAANRSFQSCSRVVTMIDQIMQRSVNDVARTY